VRERALSAACERVSSSPVAGDFQPHAGRESRAAKGQGWAIDRRLSCTLGRWRAACAPHHGDEVRHSNDCDSWRP
jgi:hypothetical protein